MFKYVKRIVSVALIAMLVLTSFVGCGKKEATKLDESAILMTVGEEKVTVGLAHFYIRYQQSLMETVFGTDSTKWQVKLEDGTTREEAIRTAIVEQLQELYIIYGHAKDYDIELEKTELEYIDSLAKEFEKSNSKEAQEKAGATKENAAEYMRLSMMVMKIKGAMKKDIDTNVELEDAKQKRMSYVMYSKVETDASGNNVELSKDKIAEQKEAAEKFLKDAKANGNLKTYGTEKEASVKTVSFDGKTTSIDEKLVAAADKLKENEFAAVVEGKEAFYVVQLESLYDVEATDTKMETILEERGEARYKELLEKWTEETKIDLDEELLEKISFQDLEVVYVEEEKSEEESKDETKEDTSEDKDETTTEE